MMQSDPISNRRHCRTNRPPANLEGASEARRSATTQELRTLRRRLRKLPEARADVVANARRLVADAAYPSSTVLRKTAELVAEHLRADAV